MGKITKKDHLKKVDCSIKDIKITATIWYENGYFNLIQNIRQGNEPNNSDWKKYGNYSWRFIPNNLKLDGIEIFKIYNKNNNYELWEY